MRLHFARRPLECYYVKVHHVTRPSRALLESTREKWVSENGSIPSGNDNGEVQNVWENALDCTPLMTGKCLSGLFTLLNAWKAFFSAFLCSAEQCANELTHVDSYILNCTLHWELTKLVGSHGSLSLPIVMMVTV
jgi:hypothetical protein